MQDEPRSVVHAGYDALGPRYLEWTLAVDPVHRDTYQARALELLDPGSLVVELGCGPGIPVAQSVAQRHRFVGVDLSAAQLALARANVPSAHLVRADITSVAFRPASVDAVLAFYAVIHVPRREHAGIFGAVNRWLRPGGVLALNLTAHDDPGRFDEWIGGVSMYWSGFDAEANLDLVRDTGFEILRAETLTNFEHDRDVRFLWVLAQKTRTS